MGFDVHIDSKDMPSSSEEYDNSPPPEINQRNNVKKGFDLNLGGMRNERGPENEHGHDEH